MPSRTSYFNWGVFKKNMQRFWLVPASLFLLFYLSLINMGEYFRTDMRLLFDNGSAVILFVAVGYGCIAALCCFSYLFRSNSAYMLHALPVRRTSLFWSNYLSGFTFLLLPMLLTLLIIGLRQLGFDHWLYNPLYFRALCLFLLDYVLQCFFFYTFAVLCAMLTGNVVAMPLLYLVLNFTVPVVEVMLRAMASVFIYGLGNLDVMNISTVAFSPIAYIAGYMTGKNVLFESLDIVRDGALLWHGWPYLFVLALVAVLMIVLCLLLYKKRHLETAGDVISHNVLRPVFKYCFTFGCAVVLGSAFYAVLFLIYGNGPYGDASQWLPYTLCLLAGAFIGYFGAEMMLKKRLRVFKSGARGFAVAAAVILALCCVFRFDVFGVTSRVPELRELESLTVFCDSVQDVHTVRLDPQSDAALIEEWRSLHELLIDERDSTSEFIRTLREQGTDGLYYGYSAELVPMAAAILPATTDTGEAERPLALKDIMQWQSGSYFSEYRLTEIRFVYNLRNGRRVDRLYQVPITTLLLHDGRSSANRLSNLLASDAMIYKLYGRFLALTPADVFDMSYYIAQENGQYRSGDFGDGEFAALLAAMQEDVRAGRLGRPYLYGDPDYYTKVTTLNLSLDCVREDSVNDKQSKMLDWFGFDVTSDSSSTLEALYALGVLAR